MLIEDTQLYKFILDSGLVTKEDLEAAKKDLNKGAQGLDCVHEMNTINHYVGMFPIATGAPVEKPLAKFFFGFFAVMILAFALPRKGGLVPCLQFAKQPHGMNAPS
jgi:hypothetical protein